MEAFHRFELDYLMDWLKRPNRKPLLMRGARQVGKSTLVRLFAKKANLRLIELDFEKNPEYADLFKSKDPKTIVALLSAQFNTQISVDTTLLFLDEIKKTPEVISSLRYFYELMPELAVIAAGSLLDLTLKTANFSIPVGRIEYLYLGPLNFEAFLLATNKQSMLNFLKQYEFGQTIPNSLHQTFLDCVKTYFLIGGLPEAVVQYIETDNFITAEHVKKNLIIAYQEDFSKYATPSEQQRMRLIFNKVPRILGEKFKYSNIDPEQKSTIIKSALHQLCLARLINVAYHTDANGLPLGAEVNEKNFKAYFLDVGLVSSALDLSLLTFKDISDFTLVNSGKIAEQFVAQEVLQQRSLYEQPTLYYWLRENKSASAEIDFIISFQSKIIPIEVKAGSTGTLKSLHYFLSEKNLDLGIRFCNQKPSLLTTTVKVHSKPFTFTLLSLPFYLIGQLQRLLNTRGC